MRSCTHSFISPSFPGNACMKLAFKGVTLDSPLVTVTESYEGGSTLCNDLRQPSRHFLALKQRRFCVHPQI
jgi:hypothetical protein